MHLQFVGCGDAFGSGGRFNTCFHLVGRRINALIDCGATSLVAMNKLAINPNDVNTIFISHFHADHVGGLPFFILELELCPQTPARPHRCRAAQPKIALWGHHGDRLSGNEGDGVVVSVDAKRIGDRQAQRDRPSACNAFHVVHDDRAGPCLGFRFEAEGKVIAFSGDTEWTSNQAMFSIYWLSRIAGALRMAEFIQPGLFIDANSVTTNV